MAEIVLVKRVKYAGDVLFALMDAGWDLKTATEILKAVPDAADVVPVVHGRWEWLGRRAVDCGYEKHLKCSVCGWEKWYYDANYCPNCGARMDGE